MINLRLAQTEFDSSKKVRETDQAVIVPSILARECVSNYCNGRGYKPGSELKAAAFTLDGTWVVVYSHIPTVQVQDRGVIRGQVHDVVFDDKINAVVGDVYFLKALCDEATLSRARSGELSKDVSCAYFSDDIYEPGKFADQPFDFKQTNFMFGHVAVGVAEGRCPAPFCGLQMDSFDGFLRVNVRDAALFACRLSTLAVDAKMGVYALVGKLKKNLLASGYASGDAVAREYLFDVSKGWTPEKAQAWVREQPNDQVERSGCGQVESCTLDSAAVLARSRELLDNMPKGRKNVMTSAGWGTRHHDGAL